MNVLDIVNRMQSDLELLAERFSTPSAADFLEFHQAFEQLEQAFHLKTLLDASFTYSAMSASAGSVVGSSKTIDYLTKRLHLSKAEARHRMTLADLLHRAGSDAAARCLDAATTFPPSAETARTLSRLPGKLDPDLKEHIPELVVEGCRVAAKGSPDEAKRLLHDRVADLNNQLDPDPARARRKRTFRMGKQDRDGGVEFYGYAPAGDAALLEAALARGVRGGAGDADEQRTFTQQCFDALMAIVRGHESCAPSATKGLGTVVLSLTQKDLDQLTPTSQIRTNTSYRLTPYEALAIGLSANGMAVLHGPDGDPVTAISHTRNATIEQRLVLAATEGTCSHPGCDRPPIWCDSHHITAWIQGGNTSLSNLSLLCRHHHTSNDDTKRRPDRGHAERCTHTKRVAYHEYPGAPPTFNDSYPAHQSAGARLRA